MLMTHYREPIDFSVKRLEEAERMLGRWAKIRKTQSERDWQELNSVLSNPIPVDTIITPLSDDLNTHAVIQALQSMARAAEGGTDYVALRLLGTIAFLGIDLAGATAGLSAPEIEDTLINDAMNASPSSLPRTGPKPTGSATSCWPRASSSRTARIPRPASG
jgi:cysteinyl-tRNA synthetase